MYTDCINVDSCSRHSVDDLRDPVVSRKMEDVNQSKPHLIPSAVSESNCA